MGFLTGVIDIFKKASGIAGSINSSLFPKSPATTGPNYSDMSESLVKQGTLDWKTAVQAVIQKGQKPSASLLALKPPTSINLGSLTDVLGGKPGASGIADGDSPLTDWKKPWPYLVFIASPILLIVVVVLVTRPRKRKRR